MLVGQWSRWFRGSMQIRAAFKGQQWRATKEKGQAISVTAGRPTARHLLKLVQQKWMAGVLPMD